MKTGFMVMGACGALLVSSSAMADCHDARVARSRATSERCLIVAEVYQTFWSTGIVTGPAPAASPQPPATSPTPPPPPPGGGTEYSERECASAPSPTLQNGFVQEAQLTGTNTAGGREGVVSNFVNRRRELGGSATYSIKGGLDNVAGGHLKVGGFLHLIKRTRLSNMAWLKWSARIVSADPLRQEVEDVTMIVLRTGTDRCWPWQAVSMRVVHRPAQGPAAR
jgi:hypothetical protein